MTNLLTDALLTFHSEMILRSLNVVVSHFVEKKTKCVCMGYSKDPWCPKYLLPDTVDVCTQVNV